MIKKVVSNDNLFYFYLMKKRNDIIDMNSI